MTEDRDATADSTDDPETEGVGDSADAEGVGDSADAEGVGESADAEGVGESSDAEGVGESADAEGVGESSDAEGVDTNHVMNLTFVLTLLFGVPTVVVLSLFVPLDGWNEIITFVVRVGAAIWFLTAVGLYVREWMALRA